MKKKVIKVWKEKQSFVTPKQEKLKRRMNCDEREKNAKINKFVIKRTHD